MVSCVFFRHHIFHTHIFKRTFIYIRTFYSAQDQGKVSGEDDFTLELHSVKRCTSCNIKQKREKEYINCKVPLKVAKRLM